MRNIYNIITDIFDVLKEDETKYNIDIQFGGLMFISYDIKICARDPSFQTYAGITLLLDNSLEPYDYHQHNRHFQRWENIFPILDSLLIE
jgi:hypothetical protein